MDIFVGDEQLILDEIIKRTKPKEVDFVIFSSVRLLDVYWGIIAKTMPGKKTRFPAATIHLENGSELHLVAVNQFFQGVALGYTNHKNLSVHVSSSVAIHPQQLRDVLAYCANNAIRVGSISLMHTPPMPGQLISVNGKSGRVYRKVEK